MGRAQTKKHCNSVSLLQPILHTDVGLLLPEASPDHTTAHILALLSHRLHQQSPKYGAHIPRAMQDFRCLVQRKVELLSIVISYFSKWGQSLISNLYTCWHRFPLLSLYVEKSCLMCIMRKLPWENKGPPLWGEVANAVDSFFLIWRIATYRYLHGQINWIYSL